MADRRVCPWCGEGFYDDGEVCKACRGTDRYAVRGERPCFERCMDSPAAEEQCRTYGTCRRELTSAGP